VESRSGLGRARSFDERGFRFRKSSARASADRLGRRAKICSAAASGKRNDVLCDFLRFARVVSKFEVKLLRSAFLILEIYGRLDRDEEKQVSFPPASRFNFLDSIKFMILE
jgi:hypothetical protein